MSLPVSFVNNNHSYTKKIRSQEAYIDANSGIYCDYPGTNFGATEQFIYSNKIYSNSIECEEKPMPISKYMKRIKRRKKPEEEILSKSCNCQCLKPRSEPFYDMFLTDNVKRSPEYREMLNMREKKLKAQEVEDEEEVSFKLVLVLNINQPQNLFSLYSAFPRNMYLLP